MVRSALGNRGGTGPLAKGPRAFAAYYPAATIVAGSMMSLLPIVSHSGWWPDWGLLMLVAPRGSTIRVTTSGPDAEPLMQALTELVGDYFGEGR